MGLRHSLVGAVLIGIAFAPGVARAAAPVNAEVAALRTAYLDLNQGDHDYKGHRLKALHHVEAACRLLGLKVSGDGNAKSAQIKSDSMLRDAQSQLQAVSGAAAANGQDELKKVCDEALKQIKMALDVK